MDRKVVRPAEAADYMGVGVSTIWLWAKQKRFSIRKISPRVSVILVSDLDRLVGEQTEENDST